MKPLLHPIRGSTRLKRGFVGAAFFGLALGSSAQAKTCTVDLDEVQVLRKEILDIVKSNMHVDKDRAAAAKRKLGDALKGGEVTVDPNDFKGIVSLKGKPSPAVVQDVLARLQNVIASCRMTKLIVDGREVDVPAEYTLLQACEAGGAEIPRFCFHERLSIAGNCRMCLIEVKGNPKPQASCAMAVRDLRPGPNGEPPVLNTKTPMVKKAREGVMEFLLINHPLDCPICDQGGECDLQDQAMAYGVDTSRFHENKRAVEDKYLGPLVKTSMNRCIHCTRCVRFITEVAGVADLRRHRPRRGHGDHHLSRARDAFRAAGQRRRSLPRRRAHRQAVGAAISAVGIRQAPKSIDVMDGLGSAIRVNSRGREVMRILPRVNDDVNEEWISDKTRHVVDGLRTQRLDKPYLRGTDGKLRAVSWREAFAAIKARFDAAAPERIGAIAGELASVEEMFALKLLMEQRGTRNIDAREDGSPLHPRFGRASYLFNARITGLEEADAILLVGVNPRRDGAVLNARIRKRWRMGNLRIGLIGERADLTYPYEYLGAGGQSLASIVAGEGDFAAAFRAAKKPLLMLGRGALAGEGGLAQLALAGEGGKKLRPRS